MGRGRNSGSPQQQPGSGGQYGGQSGAPPYPGSGPYPGGPGGYPGQGPAPHTAPNAGGRPWPPPQSDEPEYFGGHPGRPGRGGDGYNSRDDNPGHTRAFTIGDHQDAYGPGDGYGDDGYGGPDDAATYRTGQPVGPPPGPRLHWKQLLSGIILRPQATFWQMRDYQVWGPALIVTLLYGVLAVFGFEEARKDILEASTSTSVPWVLISSMAVTISALMLGSVTHALARQFGGEGVWAPTVGLSMLIMSMTDAPRLVFAVFLPADQPLVQILGWVTWLLAGALLTSMVNKSHDLPWPKALGACSIQLIALLVLLKLPTLSG